MTVTRNGLTKPTNNDPRTLTGHRRLGLALLGAGILIAMAVAIIAIVQGNLMTDPSQQTNVGRLFAVDFGLNTLALGTIKVAIAVVLVGILVRISYRITSVKRALAVLKPDVEVGAIRTGTIDTPYGTATVATRAPEELAVHRMARRMWFPATAMGAMLVIAGTVASWVWAGNAGTDPRVAVGAAAWTQALQFLGEGLLLSGISFLLAMILGRLRAGGGEVQESLGVPVETLEMSPAAKLFIAFMALGLMIEMVQFGFYVFTTTLDDATLVRTYFAWLGPLREVGLGMLLTGIVMALAAIGNALGFQFSRVRRIVTTGR